MKNRWRMIREMLSFPLEKQVKTVIASVALHNFIRINARMNMEFKRYDDDDQGLLPLNEEDSRMDSLVEEDGSHHTREMEEECD